MAWRTSSAQYAALTDTEGKDEASPAIHRPRRHLPFIIAGLASTLLLTLLLILALLPPPLSPPRYITSHISSSWHGWSSINQLIVFGDSWSSTGFNPNGTLPSSSNHFGNPAWPGETSTYGLNWVQYLSTHYNESLLLTVDFAVGGATIDKDLIRPGAPASFFTSLDNQVAEFLQFDWSWSPDTSLFAIWIGVNDITAYTNVTRSHFAEEFDIFHDLLNDLYLKGARNFLILNAPPMQWSPTAFDASTGSEWIDIVPEWNANLTGLVTTFDTTHPNTTTLLFDTYQLFSDATDDPSRFAETSGIKTTDEYCKYYAFLYANHTIDQDYHDPRCRHQVGQYFWLNSLHITTEAHNLTAKMVARALPKTG